MSAQKQIDAVLAKCMEDKQVDRETVYNRDPQTKRLTKEILSLTLSESQPLAKELLAAVEQEKANATKIIESVHNGQTQLFLSFETEGKGSLSYSLNIDLPDDWGEKSDGTGKAERIIKITKIDKRE